MCSLKAAISSSEHIQIQTQICFSLNSVLEPWREVLRKANRGGFLESHFVKSVAHAVFEWPVVVAVYVGSKAGPPGIFTQLLFLLQSWHKNRRV